MNPIAAYIQCDASPEDESHWLISIATIAIIQCLLYNIHTQVCRIYLPTYEYPKSNFQISATEYLNNRILKQAHQFDDDIQLMVFIMSYLKRPWRLKRIDINCILEDALQFYDEPAKGCR